MAKIKANNLCVSFPLYNVNSRSLRNKFLKVATGGLISNNCQHVEVSALSGLNFELISGDRVGLVGHNGAGKTTLLKVMNGVYPPTKGSILVDGTISTLIDISIGIDPEATGVDNILIRGVLMGYSLKFVRSKLEEIIEFSGLGDYINLPVRTYSSGMHLRLSFAISTTFTSNIILMDEWLSVGDEDFQKKAESRINSVIDRTEILVLSSHSKDLISKVCNKVFYMEHGKIVDVLTGSQLDQLNL